MDILKILSDKGLATKDQVKKAQEESETQGITIEQALLKQGISPRDILFSLTIFHYLVTHLSWYNPMFHALIFHPARLHYCF